MTAPLHDDDGLPDVLRAAHTRFASCDIYEAADWYDVDYAAYRAELSFYRSVVSRHVGIDGVVVELGAGTGRLTLPLLEQGVRVHAVEPAPSMRARLVARIDDRFAHASVEDARADTFVGPRDARVDVVMFPFNGLLHLRDRAALHAAFSHVRHALAPGGVFAFDVTGPYWESMLLSPVTWGRPDVRVHPTTGRRVHTCDRSTYDGATRTMRIDIRYVVEGERDGVEVTLTQRMWTYPELLAAVERAGFDVTSCYGDVDLSAFHDGAPRLLAIATRR